MHATQKDMEEFHKQIRTGAIQRAYRTLLSYMMKLRTHFEHTFGVSSVSGLYQGCMDMTCFALTPGFLKPHGLKVAVVFNYDAFRFEVWLAARNRTIQKQYWELFRNHDWGEYRVVTPAAGIDSIIEGIIAEDFDIDNPDALTSRIEHVTNLFIERIERFLSGQHARGTDKTGS